MCGRFTQTSPKIVESLGVKNIPLNFAPSYNIAPSQQALVVLGGEKRTAIEANFGFTPGWMEGRLGPINAKIETVEEKPMFRGAFLRHRCVVPVSGFYEWKGEKGEKIPYYIHPSDSEAFWLAGIFDEHLDSEKKQKLSFAILTTTPNDLMTKIHTRMPVILDEKQIESWLSTDEVEHDKYLSPHSSHGMTMHSVSTRVNIASNNDASLIQNL